MCWTHKNFELTAAKKAQCSKLQYFYPINLQQSIFFLIRVENSVDPDQMALSEAS